MLISSFLSRIRKFDHALAPRSHTAGLDKRLGRARAFEYALKRNAKRLHWALKVKDEAATLKDAIAPQLAAVSLYLQVLDLQRLDTMRSEHGLLAKRTSELEGKFHLLAVHVEHGISATSHSVYQDTAIKCSPSLSTSDGLTLSYCASQMAMSRHKLDAWSLELPVRPQSGPARLRTDLAKLVEILV